LSITEKNFSFECGFFLPVCACGATEREAEMKTAATVLLITLMAIPAGAENRIEPVLPKVTICIEGMKDFRIMAQSQAIAGQMLAAAGVKIDWRPGLQGCSAQSILITLSERTPADLHPSAMAYALPYEGAHIRLFYDRITMAGPRLLPRLLSHVLAHEVTHILQGVARHSDEGLMKARWDLNDYNSMLQKPLSFTDEDIDLIHRGVQARNTRLVAVR
jgi:hypothetical protein